MRSDLATYYHSASLQRKPSGVDFKSNEEQRWYNLQTGLKIDRTATMEESWVHHESSDRSEDNRKSKLNRLITDFCIDSHWPVPSIIVLPASTYLSYFTYRKLGHAHLSPQTSSIEDVLTMYDW
jgi:hypothetical protein